MKFLDIFAGIGGFRSGMQSAGHECVGFIENDKFARKSYKAIYDTEGEWSAHDIRTVRSSDLPKAECWCFGFPCQDISVAGQKKGIRKGNRSSLFYAVTNLIKNLKKEDRPQYLFIENVKNLLSINRGFDFLRLLTELDKIGYDAEWDVLDTAEVLPQHRERVYIIGHFRGKSTRQVFPIRPGEESASKQLQQVTNTITARYGAAEGAGTYVAKNQSPPVMPILTPERIKKRQNGRRFKTNNEPMFTITAQDRHGVIQVGNISQYTRFNNPQAGRVYSPGGIAPTLNTMQGGNLQPKIIQRARGKNKGGAKKIAPTLTSNDYKDNNFIYQDLTIRKLTPLECWRLQGFTDKQFFKAKNAGVSDSQLYKQAGNAVSVPIIEAIAKKL